MSIQRRRGEYAKVWKTAERVDRRGNRVQVAVESDPHIVRAAFIPQRSARAEVPGQMDIDVVSMLVDADLEDVDLWSRVEWRGRFWDVVSPPAYHRGTGRTRHWTITLRGRPNG